MAQKRMFSLQVVDTDKFMDMSTSAQALYFHLGMHGDDDGFVASPRKVARAAGCNDDDMRLLAAKGFIIPFDSGVVVITDWRINNTLQNDRYKETIYQDEKALLQSEKNGRYRLDSKMVPYCIHNGSDLEPQHNITKHNLTKPNKAERLGADKPPSRPRFSPPSVEEVQDYCFEKGLSMDAQRFVDYYESNGWMVGRNKMKDWKAAARGWEAREKTRKPNIGGYVHGADRLAEMIRNGEFDD